MRKLTRKNLDELAKVMPVISEDEQRCYVGGGEGGRPNYLELTYVSNGDYGTGYYLMILEHVPGYYVSQSDDMTGYYVEGYDITGFYGYQSYYPDISGYDSHGFYTGYYSPAHGGYITGYVPENENDDDLTGGVITVAALTALASTLFSTFEMECFLNYITYGGDMTISAQRFNNIVSSAGTIISTGIATINGVQYYSRTVSFYQNGNYDNALGTATLYYDSNDKPIGFIDRYDFNYGDRALPAEIATRIGSYIPGQEYTIQYGIHP
jgi:hypothetical protein